MAAVVARCQATLAGVEEAGQREEELEEQRRDNRLPTRPGQPRLLPTLELEVTEEVTEEVTAVAGPLVRWEEEVTVPLLEGVGGLVAQVAVAVISRANWLL